MELANKTALVTGASTGIGRCIALELAKNGVHVLITSRNEGKLLETKKLIDEMDGTCTVFPAELGKTDSIKTFVKEIQSKTESIDILVNVAGVWHGKDEVYAGKNYETFGTDIIEETMNVGIMTPMLLVHRLITKMKVGSHILNISGTFENGGKGWIPYFVSKRALEDFTLGLADELKEREICVNCISPSDTATEEYKRFFPKDAVDAQTPLDVALLALEILNRNSTGEVFVIKKGKVSKGVHT